MEPRHVPTGGSLKGMILRVFLATSHAAMFSSTSPPAAAASLPCAPFPISPCLPLAASLSLYYWQEEGDRVRRWEHWHGRWVGGCDGFIAGAVTPAPMPPRTQTASLLSPCRHGVHAARPALSCLSVSICNDQEQASGEAWDFLAWTWPWLASRLSVCHARSHSPRRHKPQLMNWTITPPPGWVQCKHLWPVVALTESSSSRGLLGWWPPFIRWILLWLRNLLDWCEMQWAGRRVIRSLEHACRARYLSGEQ